MEIHRISSQKADLARCEPDARGDRRNALAAVLMGSVSHYWVLRDAMGEHPSGVSEDAYLAELVEMVVARFGVT